MVVEKNVQITERFFDNRYKPQITNYDIKYYYEKYFTAIVKKTSILPLWPPKLKEFGEHKCYPADY